MSRKQERPPVEETPRGVTPVGGRSLTRTEFKDQVDINLIVKRHAQGGMFDHVAPVAPTYGDFSGANDLAAAMTSVIEAQDHFDTLPAEVRLAAKNDPVLFAQMLADPDQAHLLEEAGLPFEEGSAPPSPSPPAEPTGEEPAPPEGGGSPPE